MKNRISGLKKKRKEKLKEREEAMPRQCYRHTFKISKELKT